jgi:hypothetical protein
MRKKSLRPSSDMFSYATDEAGSDVSVQSKIIELYRTLAGAGKWTVTSSAGTEKEPQKQILAGLTAAVLPGVPRRTEGELLGEPLREVFDLFSHYDREFDHPRKVAELACSLFDQTVDLHEYGGRERALLFYAAMLHDIGHALSETRHEEFTFDAIMRHQFVTVSDHDRDLVANIAFLHRQPLARLNFRHMNRMNEADRLRVKRLAALLRIADALDDSGKRVVQEVRCYPEHGAVCVDHRSVTKALPERAEALRKADLFEEVYRRSVVVGRNRIEKLARDRRRLEPEGVAPSGS